MLHTSRTTTIWIVVMSIFYELLFFFVRACSGCKGSSSGGKARKVDNEGLLGSGRLP